MSGPNFHQANAASTARPTSALGRAVDELQRIRAVVPWPAVPALVRRRLDTAWADPAFRAVQEGHMAFLLEHTDRADEIPTLARAYAERMMLRNYQRWHPRTVAGQEVRGIEWLTTERDPGRPCIMSFLHHHKYEGLFTSLAQRGAPMHVLASPLIIGKDVAVTYRQQHKVVFAHDATVSIPAEGGTESIIGQIRPGQTWAIAPDVPGRTPLTFLGREVLASFGTARIAIETDSPIVLCTCHRDGRSSYLQLHEPLEPRDFASAGELFLEVMRRHEGPVLAWPEAVDTPRARFGTATA